MTSPPVAEPVAMRRIAREGVLLAGGGGAILLQLAHPAVARAVAGHSDFARRPLQRLHTTMTYVFGVTFGTPQEAAAVSRSVTAVHRRVAGPGYDANDPELQLWVAATLYATGVGFYEQIFGRLDDATADQVYREHAILGTALRVPPALWPADRHEFTTYWDHMVATLEIGEDARRVAHDVLHPSALPLRAGGPLLRLLTAGLLPARVRDSYGLPWDSGTQRRYALLLRGLRAAYPRLPMAVREAPKAKYLHDLHSRIS